MIKKSSFCRICNSIEIQIISIGKTELIKCLNCGISYLKNLPIEDTLLKYYENNYFITPKDNLKTEKRRLHRIPEQLMLISEIKKFVTAPATILDIGCDKGFFLDEARRHGYKVVGIEPSKVAREYCHKIGIDVFNNINKIESKWDIIVLWHSLEHILNPLEFMRDLKELISENGFVFIRVPDFNCIWSKIFKNKWIWFSPSNHYFYYTKKSLEKLLSMSGFEVIKSEKRHPNTKFTKKMNRLTTSLFFNLFKIKIGWKEKLLKIYENITAIELYAVAIETI